MKYGRLAPAFVLVVLISSCRSFPPPVGDGALRVKGAVSVPRDRTAPCLLELRGAGSDATVHSAEVLGEFLKTFTVAPEPSTYYFLITCPGTAQRHQSAEFEVRDLSQFHDPVDLGLIDLY